MSVLVTGGAGYIGSHITRELLDEDYRVVVLDDLSHGHREAVDPRAIFVEGATADFDALVNILKKNKIEAVMHFAANIEVGESVVNPYAYYSNNFSNSLNLLRALHEAGVRRLVFSSTAAVYGDPGIALIDETHPRAPINPYGRSKMMVELALEDFANAYGLGYATLRYFNVAGAHPDGTIGEDHRPESHLIPRILQGARSGHAEIRVFGTNYPTPDGTCVRDYVHVVDLARAHILALRAIKPSCGEIFNVGSQKGFSVREVVAACEKVTGIRIKQIEGDRRAGDPAILVASSRKIRSMLGWSAMYPDLESIVCHAWNWHTRRPNGYSSS
jgi:UDP-glucose 4-epimerase